MVGIRDNMDGNVGSRFPEWPKFWDPTPLNGERRRMYVIDEHMKLDENSTPVRIQVKLKIGQPKSNFKKTSHKVTDTGSILMPNISSGVQFAGVEFYVNMHGVQFSIGIDFSYF